MPRRYIIENLEEQRQKEEEIAALSGELRSMGVNSGGFFGPNFRGGNPRARGRFGRGAASTGRGAGYGAGHDAHGGGYSEPAGPERFGPARGGAVLARGGRGGRGRGAPAYNAGGAPAYNAGGAPAYNAGGAPAYNAGGAPAYNAGGAPAYNAGAGQGAEAHLYTGDARGVGRGANGSVAAVQRAQGVVVTLTGLHAPAPAPRQPLPPAATPPQGAQQRQVHLFLFISSCAFNFDSELKSWLMYHADALPLRCLVRAASAASSGTKAAPARALGLGSWPRRPGQP